MKTLTRAQVRLLCPFILTILFFLSGVSQDQNSPAILLILDASGSMWGRIENRTKIEIAREVITDLIPDLPANVQIGMISYGHRRKGDCSDIELVADLQSPGQSTIRQAVKRLNPKGKTPIAGALESGGKQLTGAVGRKSIVLVSDGLETCGGDPCAVVAALRGQGINLVVHMVGFDVSGKEVEQLRCIAEKGGGRYFQAKDSAELSSALKTVRDHVAMETPLPPDEEPVVAPSQPSSTRVRIAGPGTVKLDPASWVSMPPYYWLLADAETGTEVTRTNRDEIRVKAGTYQIVWRQVQHGAQDVALTATVKVKSGKTSEVPLDTGIQLKVPEGVLAPYYWYLADSNDQAVGWFYGTLGPALVPAGTFKLIWRQTQHGHTDLRLAEATIQAGQLDETVIGSGVAVSLPDWLQPPYYFSLRKKDGSSLRIPGAGVQLVPPGSYQVFWRQTQHEHTEVPWGSLTVPGDRLVRMELNSGLTFVAGQTPPPYRVTFSNLEGGVEGLNGTYLGSHAAAAGALPDRSGAGSTRWCDHHRRRTEG